MSEIILHLLVGPLLLTIFYIVKAKPPKKINKVYGYRTPASMRTQETWDFANEYSTDWMIKLMWVLVVFIQLPSYFLFESSISIMLSVGAMLIFLFVPILMTEQRLKQMFDEDGNWKDEFV